jgi:transglutaminase-like putative cysteine protease
MRPRTPRYSRRLALAAASALLLAGCAGKAPEISSISPRIGTMGETLSIYGKNFGPEREESYVSIAGTPPTGSSYLRWTDDHIALRVPEFGDAGLVYVHVGRRKSNPVLFSNRAAMPRPIQGEDPGQSPRILAVEPASGATGSLVTIRGSGFGSSREGSGVFFSWDAESSPAVPVESRLPETVEVSEADFGYELWNEREIQVRVPDGAKSGNLEVRGPRGNSRPVDFEITGKPGTKTFKEKRSYTISYSVDIRVSGATVPNALYLWVPLPAFSSSQRNLRLLSRSREPFVEHFRRTSLFQLSDLAPLAAESVNLSYLVDVYAVETDIRPQAIRPESPSPLRSAFTRPSALIPSEDPGVKLLAAAITGRERNPYLKAEKIYRWLVTEGGIGTETRAGGALEALGEKRADSFQGALLFCALARAAGIPALPLSGVLVDRLRGTSRHYWAEFWIDGFGWVPLDPALGAGAAPEGFPLREDRETWYFGAVDNHRVLFSRGQAELSRMDPRGRAVARNREYALQNLWEEAVGGLESYSSLWGDVTITGMYIQ